MAAIRSKGNKSTEQALRYRLVRAGISGWHMLDVSILGKPDFVFKAAHLLVFVDGCYWHGCPKCYRAPGSNPEFWSEKVARNRRRDSFVVKQLKNDGWQVLRVWEHEMKKCPDAVLAKIRAIIIPPAKVLSARAG